MSIHDGLGQEESSAMLRVGRLWTLLLNAGIHRDDFNVHLSHNQSGKFMGGGQRMMSGMDATLMKQKKDPRAALTAEGMISS